MTEETVRLVGEWEKEGRKYRLVEKHKFDGTWLIIESATKDSLGGDNWGFSRIFNPKVKFSDGDGWILHIKALLEGKTK